MKLLVQSDDFGITMGTAHGAVYAIKHGIVRNTGLFANMPYAEQCVELIRPLFDRIAFGIDMNLVNGPSVLGHNSVPALCREDGTFFSIRENRALDNEENGMDHVNGEQVYDEFKAQIEKFICITGKKPDYIHDHAYVTKTIRAVTETLAKEYEIPYSIHFSRLSDSVVPVNAWYTCGTMEQQLEEDPLSYILDDRNGYLGHAYGYLITHCGFLDSETLHLPFNICRRKDLEAITSRSLKEWIIKNNIELITFRDIADQIME